MKEQGKNIAPGVTLAALAICQTAILCTPPAINPVKCGEMARQFGGTAAFGSANETPGQTENLNQLPKGRDFYQTLAPRDVGLKKEFEKLSSDWKRETFYHSSLGRIVTHPAYVRIIGMGRDAIPFVLGDLEKSPDKWFYALRNMAGFDAAAGISDFQQARNKWLEWGRANHYL